MATNIYLTDESSDVDGYLVARVGSRSDNPSLVRSVTNTEAGASAGIQITRTAGGSALKWLTPPLDGTDLTAVAWVAHVWSKESAAAANAALRFQVYQYVASEAGTALLDDNNGTELGTTIADYNRTTGAATLTTMADKDRLAIKILLDDAGTMGASQTVTVSYNGQYPGAEGDTFLTAPDSLAVTAAMPTATRTRVRRVLKDTDSTNPILTDNEVDQAFGAALREYSKDRPRLAIGLVSGDGSAYDFTLPRLWVAGLSSIRDVEYPTGDQEPATLDPDDYHIVDSVLGIQPVRKLRFRSTPDSGTDNIAVRYTTRHVHDDELDTVLPDDLDAVCYLAASLAALTLATKMAGSSDSTINADSVQYRTSSDLYRSTAKDLRARYDAHMGAGDREVPAAGGVRDWDTGDSLGRDRLFHGRRRR